VIKQNAPCAASWTDEKRFQPERHLSPLHGDDLRRLAAFLADVEKRGCDRARLLRDAETEIALAAEMRPP